MFSKLEFFIAWRYLKAKRKEGFISITAIFSFVGIMIGVATLIIVMSVMNGFRYELVERILGINSHLAVYGREAGGISNYAEIMDELHKIPGVKYVNPLVESQVMLAHNGKAVGGLVKGVNLQDLQHKNLIRENIVDGDLAGINEKNGIIIGSDLAASLNLHKGDALKIISPETSDTILGMIPRIKTYRVAGIFQSGLYEYDSTTIFMNLQAAQLHFRYRNNVSAIEIFSDNPTDLTDLSIAIQTMLLQHAPGAYLMDWQRSNGSFLEALKVERTVMFLILTLIILVAAFNIISSMIMLVNDKNRNIACMRTMGMERRSVMRIFLICGGAIGLVGTLLGTLIGVLFSANINQIKMWLESITDTTLFNPTIYFLSTLPAKIFVSDVVVIVAMSLLISFLATIYPAYKASKSNPAEILRYE